MARELRTKQSIRVARLFQAQVLPSVDFLQKADR